MEPKKDETHSKNRYRNLISIGFIPVFLGMKKIPNRNKIPIFYGYYSILSKPNRILVPYFIITDICLILAIFDGYDRCKQNNSVQENSLNDLSGRHWTS